FRPPGSDAEIRPHCLSDGVVVGCCEGGEDVRAVIAISRRLSRRTVLVAGAGIVAGAGLDQRALAEAGAAATMESHGLSAFGDLAYPPDFPHFKYANPNAPKGGLFSQIGPDRLFNQNFLTFNSLNSFILKGDAAQGMELTFASLMVRAGD